MQFKSQQFHKKYTRISCVAKYSINHPQVLSWRLLCFWLNNAVASEASAGQGTESEHSVESTPSYA